ncbi:MAG: hypothetical protein PHE86_00220 [Candidatus Marinimicrobia bacterium]|nr:hypothetical protein [Candidatus Neomarinimicrobiota bacterium]MDD5583136.1 hypothetical protein [Candidatus Neomarinimicrobiota bacterium]
MHVVEQVGQERISRKLLKLIQNNRVGNGYILAGPWGSGKMSLALNFSAALNCQNPHADFSPCNTCESCLKIKRNAHPNIYFIFPSPAGKNPKDDDPFAGLTEQEFEKIQEAIENMSNDPYKGIEVESSTTILISMIRKLRKDLMLAVGNEGWQVVIVYRGEMLNESSSNALLKILEEPPKKTVFLILTDKYHVLLPTIRSRCQKIPVNPPSTEDIAAWLMEKYNLNQKTAAYYAHYSNGDIRLVKEFLATDLQTENEAFKEFWRYLMSGNMTALTQWIDDTSNRFKKDKEAVRREIRHVLFWLRDAYLLREGGTPSRLINVGFEKELNSFVHYYPTLDYLKAIRETERVIELTRKNVYFPALIGHFCLFLTEELAHARLHT